jgi:hypothetical protein
VRKRPVRNGQASELSQLLVSIMLVNKMKVVFVILSVIFITCVFTLSSKQKL